MKQRYSKKITNRGSVSAILKAAEELNVNVEIVSSKKAIYKLSFGNKMVVFKELLIPNNPIAGHMLACDKNLTRRCLQKNNIPIPKGKSFNDANAAFAYGKKIGYPLVAKSHHGTHGDHVRVGIENDKELRSAIKDFLSFRGLVIIEELVPGDDFRILVLEDKILGALQRVPANIVGDGHSSIKKLIAQKNKDPKRGIGHRKSLCKIIVDNETKRVLKNQHLSLESVPSRGETIFLRKNANISSGGDSVDVTDLINPKVKKIAVDAVKSIGLKLGAIDYLSKDISQTPEESGGVIIEINSNPMITIHEVPAKGKPRKVAREIVKYCLGIE